MMERTPEPSNYSAISRDDSVDVAVDAEASILETKPEINKEVPEPPPNGGLFAWLQVAGSFFLLFNCWGTVNTFGAFQTYYENNPHWKESPSNISWIGSIQAFLLLMIGGFSGPVYDRGYFRTLVVTGTIFISFGFMMTSLCQQYWQVVLAQGILIGLGNGCLFVPSVAIIPQYFTTKKAFANGLAVTGSSMGGIIYPIVFRELQQQIGFGWATRVLGFLALGTLTFSIVVMRQRIMPKQQRKLLDLAAFTDISYSLYCLGAFLAFISFYGPINYIASYAIQEGITSTSFAFYLLPILNAGGVTGRILPNYLGDRIGIFNVLIPACFFTGVMAFAWIGISTFAGIIVFALLYGFCSGAFIGVLPVAIVVLTKDLSKIGTRMGQAFFISSFGLLIGTPISGAILSSTGGFLWVQLTCGIILMATFIIFAAARICKVGWKMNVKM